MSNILNNIVSKKKEEVSQRKKIKNENDFYDEPFFNRPCYSLSEYLSGGSGIIAEFKRKSPSKPDINLKANSNDIVPQYEKAGASATSILTNIDFFGGTDDDLIQVRSSVNIPILRKDFIIDPYQIVESKAIGADVILLIAEILSKSEMAVLARLASELGMEVLMEVHTSDQLKKYNQYIKNVGINNRNLNTFVTNLKFSYDILPYLPDGISKVSESGIDNPETVIALKENGYNGFLIGEYFMKSSEPGDTCSSFINSIKTGLK